MPEPHRRPSIATGLLFAAASLLPTAAARGQPAADYVWWEGEAAVASTFPVNDPFGARTLGDNAALLSGGQWLNARGKGTGAPATARWKLTVPAGGEYALWARKFWRHGPFRWRFDAMPANEWRTCGPDVALAEEVQLRPLVTATWVSLGPVTLPAGERTFDVEVLAEPGKDWTAAFDCFVLARGPFVPSGKLKPGEKVGRADEGFFPFEPDVDPFRPDALLDLRPLNEPAAGQSGFLKRQGKDVARGDGTPVRFWAVNVALANAQQDRPSVDYLARKLAKLGVNMVRFHSPLWDDKDPTTLDPKKLDALHYLVAAMKKQGVYTALSFYFPIWADGQKLGLDGFDAGWPSKKPYALLFFDPKLQALYRGWCQQMLGPVNPYTKLPLARDPAVGLVEVQNEDSLLFWTFGRKNLPPVQWQRLEDRFNAWAAAKHGSTAAALRVWGGARAAGDAGDRLSLYEAYHMTAKGSKEGGPGKAKRVGDQVQFLAELQKGFYDAAVKHLKADLGVGGLVSAGNWTTADPALLGAVERWTYSGSDAIDAHGYFAGEHKGDGSDYSVRAGHTFKDAAAVRNPGLLPFRFFQVEDRPQFISELGLSQPNRYRADGVFLASAYGALQGCDGVFWFAVGSNYLRDGGMNKFQVASPAIAAAFPAAALVYRTGAVREPEPAVYQTGPVADLWALKGGGGWSNDALDDLRKRDVPPGGGRVDGQVDKVEAYAPYVGPVVRGFGPDAAKGWQRDLTKFIDRPGKTVTSLTGELRWDYGKGVAVLNAPKAQGAAGFLGEAGPVATASAKVTLRNEFGTVTVAALDGQPIPVSRRVLVQVMTQEQPTGFREQDGSIQSLGSAPFGVKRIAGTVELQFAAGGTPKVTALDPNGYDAGRAVTTTPGAAPGSVTIELQPDVLYYVVTR